VKTRFAVVACLLAVAVATPGCDWVQDRFRTCGHVTVEMRVDRQNRFEAHVAAHEEEFSAATLLQPGQSRRIALCLERGDRVRFRSEQFGAVNRVSTCVYSKNRIEAEFTTVRVVLYPDQLACENW
jgi:hypothetical protein